MKPQENIDRPRSREDVFRKVTLRPVGGAVMVTIPHELHERLGCKAHEKTTCVMRGTPKGLTLEFFVDTQMKLLDVPAKKKKLEPLPLWNKAIISPKKKRPAAKRPAAKSKNGVKK